MLIFLKQSHDKPHAFSCYTKLQEYINGLGIHENVVLSSIVVLIKQISGVTDVSGLTLNGTTDNINIGVNQIARFNSVTITPVES